jgi:hypothetical protein
MDRLRRIGVALALVIVVASLAAGCGGTKTDVTKAIDNQNQRLTQQGIPAKLDCPDQVDGQEGTDFECTIKADKGGKSAKVTMTIQKEGKDLIVIEKSQTALEKAVQTVVGQQGGGATGAQGQTP